MNGITRSSSGNSHPGTAVEVEDPASKRAYVRWGLKGTTFPIRMGKKRLEIRLKDLSRGGACGLLEEPLAIGDYFVIEFDGQHQIEAEVCWVRRVMVGVKFGNPLKASYVMHLLDRAAREVPDTDDFYLLAPPRRRTRVRKAVAGNARPA